MKCKKRLAGVLACVMMVLACPVAVFASGSDAEQTPVVTSVSENTESGNTVETGNTDASALTEADVKKLLELLQTGTGSGSGKTTGTVNVSDGSYLNMREGAGLNYNVIMHLLRGQRVEVTGTEGDWYKITLPENVGYVYKDYMNVDSVNTDGSVNVTIDEETFAKLTALVSAMFSENGGNSGASLTPDGNLTLVDDIGSTTAVGQQFITLVSKNGNTFYMVIDRNDKGEENVHFMNLVDEADLLALMDEDQQAVYQRPATVTPAEEQTVPEDTEKTEVTEPEETEGKEKKSLNPLPLLLIVLLFGGAGGAYYYLQTRKKQEASNKPDPDADYDEDGDDEDVYEIPEEDDTEEYLDALDGHEDTVDEE
ncbi:MAG: DUF4366 domain-containing protein [Ruminiclostridium sp.]|nr:DUF4366 domain-containing protein [Ruminiclostridium sp.]MCF0132678.1 DUF4366 domain-containing protein [Blautia sp.]